MPWSAQGLDETETLVDVDVREIQLEVSARGRDQIFSAAHKLLDGRITASALQSLERDVGSPWFVPGLDPIWEWGADAVNELNSPYGPDDFTFGPVGPPGMGYFVDAITHVDWDRSLSVWHEPVVLLIDVTGLQSVEIQGEPATYAGENGAYLEQPALVLDWRGYFGTGTLIERGETDFPPNESGEPSSVKLFLRKSTGFLVVTLARFLGQESPSISFDRSFEGRLRALEEEFEDVAYGCPQLKWLGTKYETLRTMKKIKSSIPDPGPAAVIVHGTMSCSVPIVKSLGSLPIQTYRFEHDTFLDVRENADELAKQIREYLPAPRLIHLIAHSRGGLVARVVAQDLFDEYEIKVKTYGTPHEGTPLANAGRRAFRLLTSLTGTTLRGLFCCDLLTLACSYLFRARSLPPGLDVMRTDSPALGFMAKPTYELHSTGGSYDFQALPDGSSPSLLVDSAEGFFGNDANDLVVSTSSAVSVGTATTILDGCDHFRYFERAEVIEEILAGIAEGKNK